ncbi:hypothetical protein ABBQ32_010445 [Trebouxia sp. C0010 RCD-2024]
MISCSPFANLSGHLDHTSKTGCQHHCDAQKLAAFGENTFPMGYASVHNYQPAQLIPHFIVAEQAHMAKFLPITHKSEQTCANSSTCEGSIKLEQSELSAEPAPSVELAHAVEKVSQDTKPSIEKKVGRPIAYKGDPNASNLSDPERRRIKRRIANRESARRVRARRHGTLEELTARMDGLRVQNAAMVKHITDVEGHIELLKGKLQECEMHWNRALASNACLQRQSSVLTAQLPGLAAQENVGQQPLAEVVGDVKLVHRAGSHNVAPITGISCSLIDELPTMAFPLHDMGSCPSLEPFDQDFPDYLI